MAIQKEIWINSIIEGLFPDNSFASKSIDHSEFVDNITVHVPNAGAPPAVTEDVPADGASIAVAERRTDVPLDYNITSWRVGPIRITKAEEVELSYNKRESVIKGFRVALQGKIYGELLKSWYPAGGSKLATGGDSYALAGDGAPSATGNRLKLVKADIRKLRTLFDKQDIPLEGRNLLLDAELYGQLLDSLTDTESAAFLASASAQSGIVGKLYGFDVYLRSTVLTVTATGALKTGAAAATDCLAGLAWSTQAVSRAVGEVTMYENESDPHNFGDVISALVRAGGKYMRNDKAGVVLLYQGTP
ncbi:MAG: hypothetical protein LBJ47_09875 [Tannerella sp.]|jgi:hypothetical protein|nr:hypothetical protein [Tannerella sp.]